MFYKVLFFTLVSLVLSACQTNMIDEFSKVRPGMDKGQVLELVGSPQATDRWRGKDRWQYIYFQNNQRIIKEVLFENGKADYVGDEYKFNENAKIEELNNSIKNNSKISVKDRKVDYQPID
jgi:outer membrane protein assembly factor BamE (lipoprotein component of BamABCDE complex)